MRRSWLTACLVLLLACDSDSGNGGPRPDPEEIPGTQVRFDLSGDAGFFDAPFPIGLRDNHDGTIDMRGFPNPARKPLVRDLLVAMESGHASGFGTNSAVYLPFDGPLDAAGLPADAAASVAADSSVFLVNVHPGSPELDRRTPVWVAFKAEAETYSPANLLSVLPRPGATLRPGTLYAAVVLDSVRDADGEPLGSPLAFETFKARRYPESVPLGLLGQDFDRLWEHLDRAGIERTRVRGATVFRTGDPLAQLRALRDHARSRGVPAASGLKQIGDYEKYCVVEGNLTVPIFQDGERRYYDGGGEIRFDESGAPVVQWEEQIRFSVTIPKQGMPAAGFSLLVYAPGQGGSYLQAVERGTFAEQDAGVPDRGPAYFLADVGIAVINIEAPLTGPRNPNGQTDGLDFFNIGNPVAFRDNFRQSAVDYVSLLSMAEGLEIDAALCPGADGGGGSFVFDDDQRFLYGHSTGASVGSLVLGLETRLRAGLLSGTGGSWLYNLTIKSEPLDFGFLVETLLGYEAGDDVDLHDPALNLAQTFWECIEPMNWARIWAREPLDGAAPRDVLVIEGVIDGYFLPEMNNALALAAPLQPVRPIVDDSMLDALELAGLGALDAPASGNLVVGSTRVSQLLLQFEQPEGISGHYVPFESPQAKYQYRCFFDSLLGEGGAAAVFAANSDPLAACP